jgi:hypothetical protein
METYSGPVHQETSDDYTLKYTDWVDTIVGFYGYISCNTRSYTIRFESFLIVSWIIFLGH